jgi:Concanavalin A-like lectin/glucanases superfamily
MIISPGVVLGNGVILSDIQATYVTSGLVLNFDASNPASYPGTGTSWTDTASSKVGTMSSGVTYSSSNGGIMTFNGTSSATVNITGFTSLTNNFTIECWYQANIVSSNYDPALWHSGTIGSSGFMVGYYSGASPANSWKATKYGVTDIYVGSIPQNASWHQVTYVYSSTTGVSVYVDGVQSGTTNSNTNNLTSASVNVIGQGESGYHSGSIGSIRMWNVVLTSTQIAQNFSVVRSKYGV